MFSAAGERTFSAGADLKERAGLTDADLLRQRHAIRGLLGALPALPPPPASPRLPRPDPGPATIAP